MMPLFYFIHSFTSAAYMDVCYGIKKKKFRYKWLDVEKSPFVNMADRSLPIVKWSGFEDILSIDYKVKYLMTAGLGGATLFSLDKDDYYPVCDQKRFPLLRVINQNLNNKRNVSFPDLGEMFQETEAALLHSTHKLQYLEKLFAKLYPIGDTSK